MARTGYKRSLSCFTIFLLKLFLTSSFYFLHSQSYTYDDILHEVQLAEILEHPKMFPDMKMRYPLQTTLEDYKKFKSEWPNPDNSKLLEFIEDHFEVYMLSKCEIKDFNPHPRFVDKIVDPKYRNWILDVIEIWPLLVYSTDEEVRQNQEQYSCIYLPNCFVKAGGFFHEIYYWDSYWIIKGMLLSEMYETAKCMICNFIWMVDKYGFIFNGSRKYYQDRSQPPVLLKMVELYTSMTKNESMVKNNLLTLEKEFLWWYNNRTVDVTKDGKTYKMARYNAKSNKPRSEAYRSDYNASQRLKTDEEREHFFTAIKSGVESGWDFSSRLIRNAGGNEGSRLSMDPQNIIFVDLNCLLHNSATLLRDWCTKYGSKEKAEKYNKIATDFFEGIEKVLWNNEYGIWMDWDLIYGRSRNYYYASNFTPLWTKSYRMDGDYVSKAIDYIIKEEIVTEDLKPVYYGVPTSKLITGEQWDFPNCWPPLQSIVIEGFHQTGNEKAQTIALQIAKIWIKTIYEGFQKDQLMFEKYNALELGATGRGGGYEPQSGFGWTNGVAIELMDRYGAQLSSNDYDNFQPASVEKIRSVMQTIIK